MNIGDIESALGQHLADMVDVPPIAWANKSANLEKPYLTTLHAPVSQINPTLDGSVAVDSLGLWLVTVVAEGNAFTTQANAVAQSIADHYRQGGRIAGTGGTVLIERVAIVGGFHDQAENWNVPVRISYRTET